MASCLNFRNFNGFVDVLYFVASTVNNDPPTTLIFGRAITRSAEVQNLL